MDCANCNTDIHISPPQDDNSDHQAEDVFRLSQEISSLRQEIVRGDRQIKELEEQVTDVYLINGDISMINTFYSLRWDTKTWLYDSISIVVVVVVGGGYLCP